MPFPVKVFLPRLCCQSFYYHKSALIFLFSDQKIWSCFAYEPADHFPGTLSVRQLTRTTCVLFTCWFWAVVSYVAIVWRSSFFTRVFFANRIAYSSTLLSLAKDEYLFHPNTGSVSWETPTHLGLFLSLFASSSGVSTLFSVQHSAALYRNSGPGL